MNRQMPMKYKTLKLCSFLIVIILLIESCQSFESKQSKKISFYHWKSKAVFSNQIQQTLAKTQSKKIYMHYFDVQQLNSPTYNDKGAYPTYVIKEIDSNFINYEIVPVIYITNQVFKTENLNIKKLAKSIRELIHQISLKHFNKEIKNIQIDCDWTQSTKHTYFDFLKALKIDFNIDITIRLHQIKYKEKTGIPPVSHGTLMLYNMGDFKDNDENSILETKIVEQYINNSTHYPLNLHLGLPLFSQTILTNNDHEYKIIQGVNRYLYENDDHFKKIDPNNYKVIKDTLYKGFYLTNGFNLKLEEIDQNEVVKSYHILEKSALNIDEIIFYHLDDKTLSNLNIGTLINEL